MSENTPKDAESEEEPSIEEILDSIRQIISDDDEPEDTQVQSDDGASDSADVSIVEENTGDDDGFSIADVNEAIDQPTDQTDDVLELTDRIDDAEESLEDSASNEDDDLVVALEEPSVDADVPETSEYVETTHEELDAGVSMTDMPDTLNGDILTEKAATAALGGFTDLVKKTAVDHSGSVTLEDIVRAELNPLLRGWLDKHLPKIIERLVQEELEKLSKRASED